MQRQNDTQSDTEQLNAQFFSVLTNSIQGSSSLLDKADWAKDLELMHHFCAITANTLATREDLRYTWRVTVPREGYSNPFLMHGILSMAALHRAYLYPAKAEEYLRLSAYHQSSGLKDFQKLLLNIQQDNWKAVFCFASMVVIYVSALPTRLGIPILPTPISNITNLLLVTKGMDAFLRPFATILRNSSLAAFALVNMVEIPLDESLFSTSLLPEDTPAQMARLREFLDCSILDPEERKDYLFAWSGLQSACNNLRYSEPHIETSMAFFWPFILPTRVMTDLQQEKPLSLVLLAHYCVLLRSLEHFWFAKGWAKPVLVEIEERLEPDLVTWLTWPNKYVFNRD